MLLSYLGLFTVVRLTQMLLLLFLGVSVSDAM